MHSNDAPELPLHRKSINTSGRGFTSTNWFQSGRIDSPLWVGDRVSRIFISYSRQDASDVDPLAKSLEAAGHEVWIDRSAIQAGARWQAEIVSGIERADVFLILLTPASIQSENVEREVGLAYVRNRAILPVLVHPVEVPPRLQYAFAGLEYVDISQQEASVAARRLLDAIASPTVRTQKVYLEGSWRDRLKPWVARVVWVVACGALVEAIDHHNLWGWVLFAATAAAVLGVVVWPRMTRKNRSQNLESRGIELTSDFKGFFGQPNPQIVTEWRDPATGKAHEFRSRKISDALTEFVERRIRVIADPQDLRNYRVDLSFLPKSPHGPLNLPAPGTADSALNAADPGFVPGHIFVSFAEQDAGEVRPLMQKLKASGLDLRTPEAATQDRQTGQEEVVGSIEGSRLFLLVLTPSSAESEQIRRELELATAKARRIVTVLLRPTVVPAAMDYALVGIQSVDLSRNFDSGVARLLEVLAPQKPHQALAPVSDNARPASPISTWFQDRIGDLYRATIGRLTSGRLQAGGQALLTEYKHAYVRTRDTGDVEHGGGIVVEGFITTQWRHPVTRDLFVFSSRALNPSIGDFIKTKTITVYVDPKDMRKYSMDLSFLGDDQKWLRKVQTGRRPKRLASLQPTPERKGNGIYVSYSQQDAGNAERVIRALKSKGHEVVNESGAPLNDDALKNAIDGAHTFLIVVPPTAADDVGEKIKELRFAQGSGRKIVPVTFGDPAIPSSMLLALSGVQCISLPQDPEIGVEPLLAALTVPARQDTGTSPAVSPRSFLQRTVERLTGALLGGLAWAVGAGLPIILSGRGWTTFHLLLAPGFSSLVCGGLSGAALYKRRASVRKWGPVIWIAGFVIFIFGFELAAYLFSVGGISNVIVRVLLGDLLGLGSFTLGWLLEARLSAEQLKSKGKLLLTEYRGIRRDSSEMHNNRQYVQVVSEWRDPGTDQVHVFVSRDFSGDPSKRIRSNTIAVFVDPHNMKNYYMDLSYSAKT
jgi:hypothetical protein